jgi:hypothetical protein
VTYNEGSPDNFQPVSDSEPKVSAQELVLFWKLANGTRCVVVQHGVHWQLRVIRHAELLLSEDYEDAAIVMARAKALRLQFDAVA